MFGIDCRYILAERLTSYPSSKPYRFFCPREGLISSTELTTLYDGLLLSATCHKVAPPAWYRLTFTSWLSGQTLRRYKYGVVVRKSRAFYPGMWLCMFPQAAFREKRRRALLKPRPPDEGISPPLQDVLRLLQKLD